MATHPLWQPFALVDPSCVEQLHVGPRQERPVAVVAPDPRWPVAFERVRATIVGALGSRALAVEHVGSTAVRGLWAKPIVDVDLTVTDSADEEAYRPALEAAGFELIIREPDWEEHRLLTLDEPEANVHVFSAGAVEPRRHRAFRDWLSRNEPDREAYAAHKRRLAEQDWADVVDYNNAKAALIYDIYERIFAADREHPHAPRPRGSGRESAGADQVADRDLGAGVADR